MKRWILILLPFFLPTYVVRFHVGPFPTTLLEVAILTALIAWTVSRGTEGWRESHQKLHEQGWAWPIFLWLLAGVISVFIAPNHTAALGLFRAYFIEPVLVLALLTDLVRHERDTRHLMRSLVGVTCLVAFWAVVQIVTRHGIPAPWDVPPVGIRATGPFPFPNALSLFVVPIAALCVVLAVNKKILSPSVAWLGFSSGLLAILLAKSVGGFFALMAATISVLVLNKATRRMTLWAVIGVIAFIAIVPPTRTAFMNQVLFKQWSGQVRVVIWKETVTMLRDHPIFGAGLGAYPEAIKPYHKATWMEIFQYPHDIVLNLWSETGLLGLIAFTWILWTWWRRGRLMALPVIIAVVVHGLVDVPYFKNDLAVLFWMLVVLTCSLTDLKNQTNL